AAIQRDRRASPSRATVALWDWITPIGAGTLETTKTAKPGECLGEMALLDDEPLCASAVALETVETLAVPCDPMPALLERMPALALALARELAGRVRNLDERLQEALWQVIAAPRTRHADAGGTTRSPNAGRGSGSPGAYPRGVGSPRGRGTPERQQSADGAPDVRHREPGPPWFHPARARCVAVVA